MLARIVLSISFALVIYVELSSSIPVDHPVGKRHAEKFKRNVVQQNPVSKEENKEALTKTVALTTTPISVPSASTVPSTPSPTTTPVPSTSTTVTPTTSSAIEKSTVRIIQKVKSEIVAPTTTTTAIDTTSRAPFTFKREGSPAPAINDKAYPGEQSTESSMLGSIDASRDIHVNEWKEVVRDENHASEHDVLTFPSEKCPHVRCEAPPHGAMCKDWYVPDTFVANGLSHTDCCPAHKCYRDDGSEFYHFGIEVDELTDGSEYKGKEQGEEASQKISPDSLASKSTFSSQSSNFESSYPPAASSQPFNAYPVQETNKYPGHYEPLPYPEALSQNAPGTLNSIPNANSPTRLGLIYPASLMELENGNERSTSGEAQEQSRFSASAQSSPMTDESFKERNTYFVPVQSSVNPSIQEQNMYSSQTQPSGASSFSPVGFGENSGYPQDRPARTVSNQFPIWNDQVGEGLTDSEPRFKRNMEGPVPLGMQGSPDLGPEESGGPIPGPFNFGYGGQ